VITGGEYVDECDDYCLGFGGGVAVFVDGCPGDCCGA